MRFQEIISPPLLGHHEARSLARMICKRIDDSIISEKIIENKFYYSTRNDRQIILHLDETARMVVEMISEVGRDSIPYTKRWSSGRIAESIGRTFKVKYECGLFDRNFQW